MPYVCFLDLDSEFLSQTPGHQCGADDAPVAGAIYAKEEEQVNKQKSSAFYTFNGFESESGILD